MTNIGQTYSSSTASLRIGLIYNPLGGLARKNYFAISNILAKLPMIQQWKVTDAGDFDHAVEALIQAKIEWLIIIGGDGTIQGLFTRIFSILPTSQWPSISIIPGGTTNMTALDLGIQEKPDQILKRLEQHLLRTINNQEFKQVSKAVIRIEQTGQPTIFGMFLGLGLIARGVKFSRSRIKQIGITGNIFTTIIVLRSLIGTFLGRPDPTWAPVQITLPHSNNTVQKESYLLVMISTLDKILMGIHPYWGEEKAPLHATFIQQYCHKFWLAVLRILLKNGHLLKNEHGYLSYNTESIDLLMDDEYIVDGELFYASSNNGPLKISAKEKVKFLIF